MLPAMYLQPWEVVEVGLLKIPNTSEACNEYLLLPLPTFLFLKGYCSTNIDCSFETVDQSDFPFKILIKQVFLSNKMDQSKTVGTFFLTLYVQ